MKNISEIVEKINFEDILKLYNNKWDLIVKHQYLTVNFIDTYFWQLKPFKIEKHQKLNPYLLFKYSECLNWQLLSKYQQLPELLIKRNISRINWQYIATYQNLSIDFIKFYQKYLKLEHLLKNKQFSEQKLFEITQIFNK